MSREKVNILGKGSFFGEISCITGMKSTASVQVSSSYTDHKGNSQPLIVTSIPNWVIQKISRSNPAVSASFQKRLFEYKDRNTLLRDKYVRNIPIFRNLPQNTIRKITHLIRQKSYTKGSVISRRGDLVNSIFIVLEGVVEVSIPYHLEMYHFDYLPPGSCFGVYQTFGIDQ